MSPLPILSPQYQHHCYTQAYISDIADEELWDDDEISYPIIDDTIDAIAQRPCHEQDEDHIRDMSLHP